MAGRLKGVRSYRPEPSRVWVRYVPTGWPCAGGLWVDPVERRLGVARTGDVPALESVALDDVVYLPPVENEQEASAEEWVTSLREQEVPVVRQCRAGDCEVAELASTEIHLLDLASALFPHGAKGLEGIATTCKVAIWPLVAGLTATSDVWAPALDHLAGAGVETVVPQSLELDAVQRRQLAEFTDDAGYQALFHQGEPDVRDFCRAAASRGLATTMDRPEIGAAPRAAFCRMAATELTLVAELWLRLGRAESAGQDLLRAARWAEGFEHDLRALAREGNLAVLPWLGESARQVVEQLETQGASTLRRELEAEYLEGE